MQPSWGPYAVVAEIGQGGGGFVLRGRGPRGEDVAIKVLKSGNPEALARFRREARLQAGLGEKEGFVPLLDGGDAPSPFLVMPFLAGGTLRDRLHRGPLSIEETVALGRKLAAAIGRAHALGIVHRDLKPENVLFTAKGEPLVADLGIAKHFRRDGVDGVASQSLSKTGMLRGTAGYMPAEQLRDSKEVKPPADVFALGAILYECL
ncbi:MAG TPA: serine/threonine-protein kinase, partial [Planctomycetota bacterium]|nr:serine/threonine-protein kinase [Planctomycetota bacterium]